MDPVLRRYYQYLRLERNFSENTLDAYTKDLDKLLGYLEHEGISFPDSSLGKYYRLDGGSWRGVRPQRTANRK